MPNWINRLCRSARNLKDLVKSEKGSAAAEFSMFLPIFVFGGLAMGDVGLALHQRMSLDHVVRAGAQVAMADPGEDKVLSALQLTASRNFTLEADVNNNISTAGDPVSLNVTRYCSCPDDRSLPVSCSSVCSATTPPFVFYRMSAAKTYNGVFLPAFSMDNELQVEIR
jgi:pilus assembly protein CpaE